MQNVLNSLTETCVENGHSKQHMIVLLPHVPQLAQYRRREWRTSSEREAKLKLLKNFGL